MIHNRFTNKMRNKELIKTGYILTNILRYTRDFITYRNYYKKNLYMD